ncbi:MAG: DUF1015 domain-containing protein [Hyphomicrobiales bacterium]|nr:DUF1015 domain-containing protein [Hyphomicrobiales bacterium]
MTLIQPFRGLRPAPGRAEAVAAPPYDVLDRREARARTAGKPWSFLHISKPEIDLADDIDPYDAAVYAKAAETMQNMIASGVLIRDERPGYYVYRLTWGDHVQTGLVAAASVADYDSGRIRKHEHTQPVKEDGRVAQIEAVNAQTGPVMMAYGPTPAVDALIGKAAAGDPDVRVAAESGVEHAIWVVDDKTTIVALTDAFEALPALYIADGHHRSAAAARVCHKRAAGGNANDAPYCRFLSVIFPHHQTRILAYNRVVADLNGHSPDALLAEIARKFAVLPADGPVAPAARGEFGMYCDGRWFRLTLPEALIPRDNPLARLDVNLLSEHLIAPVLGITDQRCDARIDFVGGIRGLDELQARVDSGEAAVAFAFFPPAMEDLMAVADAGKVMPTKSTWFEPKLADGLVSLVLD